MGRRALTAEQHAARGNPSKKNLAKKRDTVKTVTAQIALARPAWVSEATSKEVWERLHSALVFLRRTDVQVLGRYCVYVADWVTANKAIRRQGMVYETNSAHVEGMLRINPWFSVRSRIEDDLVKLEEKLGLTPLDRQRIMAGLANAAGARINDLFGEQTDTDESKGGEVESAHPVPPVEDVQTLGGLSGRRLDG